MDTSLCAHAQKPNSLEKIKKTEDHAREDHAREVRPYPLQAFIPHIALTHVHSRMKNTRSIMPCSPSQGRLPGRQASGSFPAASARSSWCPPPSTLRSLPSASSDPAVEVVPEAEDSETFDMSTSTDARRSIGRRGFVNDATSQPNKCDAPFLAAAIRRERVTSAHTPKAIPTIPAAGGAT